MGLYHPDPWAELRDLETWRAQRGLAMDQARNAATQWTPAQARLFDEVASRFDWLPPGAAMALARGEFGAHAPLAQAIANRAARQRNDTALGWRQPGSMVDGKMIASPANWRRLEESQVVDAAPLPADPGARDAYQLARQSGLTVPGTRGLLREPVDDTGPQGYAFNQIVMAYFRAGEKVPVVDAQGRPAIWTGIPHKDKYQSGDITADPTPGYVVDVKLLDPEHAKLSDNPAGEHSNPYEFNPEVMGVTSAKATEGFNTAVRALSMAANAPTQEMVGLFRAAYGMQAPSFQSDLATFARTGLPSGNGLLVDQDSPLAQERRRREARYGQIDGRNITPGRAVAHMTPLEPGSKPYSVLSGLTDATFQIVADPVAWGLGKLAKAQEARGLVHADEIAEAGGLVGLRKAVSGPTVDQALTGKLRPAIEAFAAESSPTRIWRATGRKWDPELAVQIADDAHTTDQVADIVRGQLSKTVLRAEDLDVKPANPRRWQFLMPGPGFNPEDRQDTMTQIERWLVNAKVPDHEITPILDDLARASGRAGVFDALERSGGAADASLKAYGVQDPVIRSKLTRFWLGTHRDAQHYFVDEIGGDVDVWGHIKVGDQVETTGGPHLWSEMLTDHVELPDPRPIRSLTTAQQKVLAGDATMRKAAHYLFSAHDYQGESRPVPAFFHGMMDWWRRGALMRPAWTLRVVGDEQARMAASGHDSMFRGPLSFVAWRIGRKGGETDLLGNAWDESEAFKKAMATTREWTGDPTRVATTEYTVYRKGLHEHDQFLDGWASELAQLSRDPITKKIAASPTLDEAVDYFAHGPGRKFRSDLIELRPQLVDDDAFRTYMQSLSQRVQVKTGGNTELVDAVAHGKLGDVRVFDEDRLAATSEFRNALVDRLDVAPDAVKGRVYAYGRQSPGSRAGQAIRHATDRAFGVLMTNRTNNLSRSPEFKQSYWDEAERLLPFTDQEARAGILDHAREANLDGWRLGSRRIRRMETAAKRYQTGDLTLDEVDELAKAHALDQTKDLLYDLSERHQAWDAMKLVFPFGEAWHEVWTRWAGLANPFTARGLKNLRRLQQGVQAARGEEFGALTGAPEGKGFFWTNEFGDEVFVYPFSGAVSKFLFDTPVPLTGRVQGLNMLGTTLPGLGPVVQIPVSWFLANKPRWAEPVLNAKLPLINETVGQQLQPFGGPLDEGDPGKATQLSTYLPPWAVRLAAGLGWRAHDDESDRLWANSVMQVARYLASTGDYDTSTPEGMQHLLDDASNKAQGLYFLRGLAGSTLPSAPSPDWMVEDRHGDLVRTYSLLEDFNKMVKKDPENATEDFMGRYGDQVFLLTQALSRSNVPGLESTSEFETWVKHHPELKRDLPNVFALFAPRGGRNDLSVYGRQFRQGLRDQLSPDEWLRISNNTRGRMMLDNARARVGPNPTDAERAWLRDLTEAVARDYPGFDDTDTIRASTKTLMREMEDAAGRDDVRSTPAGRVLVRYMRARDEAQQFAEDNGYAGFTQARALSPTRDWLRSYGEALVRENPEFDPLWRVLQREVPPEQVDENAA